MNVTYRTDKNILYIAVEGRIDASNAAEAEEKIFSIKNDNSGKHTVLDADGLEYIRQLRQSNSDHRTLCRRLPLLPLDAECMGTHFFCVAFRREL